jgi:hypothetical protein
VLRRAGKCEHGGAEGDEANVRSARTRLQRVGAHVVLQRCRRQHIVKVGPKRAAAAVKMEAGARRGGGEPRLKAERPPALLVKDGDPAAWREQLSHAVHKALNRRVVQWQAAACGGERVASRRAALEKGAGVSRGTERPFARA